MKSFKKLFALVLSVALISSAITAGTIAYLTSSDEDVNVMTLGNVKIEQIEQERNEKGELVDFTQAKPAYPAVGDIEWDEENLLVNGVGYKVFDDELKNVVDKVVTVKNTGKSDAYVRTIVALEAPGYDPNDLIHLSWNETDVKMSAPITLTIDGVDYVVFVFTYNEAVEAGKVSAPSLMQLFLDSKTTNEDCAKFGDAWEVLVVSQAVQVEGFADAQTALDTAFGAITAANHPWVEGVEVPAVVYSAEELVEALATKSNVILAADVALDADNTITVAAGKSVSLDLGGHKITSEADGTGNRELFLVKGNMTVKNGSIDLKANVNQGWGAMATVFDVTAGGVLNIENATIKNLGGTDMGFVVHLNNWGEVTLNVENSTLESNYVAVRAFNSGYDMNNVTIKNSTLKGTSAAFWVHNYTAADFGTEEKANAQKALLNFDIFNGTNTFEWNGTKPAPIRYGMTNSVYADANGNIVE